MTNIKAKLTNVPRDVAERLLELENVAITKKDKSYELETENLVEFNLVMSEVERVKSKD